MATRKPKVENGTKPVAARKGSGLSTRHPVKKVGRPRAKHSNPDFVQMSVYVHKEVRNHVKARLFERGEEFSGLVESLLRDWLKATPRKL